MLGSFLFLRVFNDGTPGWKHIITSDGRGYYAYLPALIIDHDPSFEKVISRESKLIGYADYKPGYMVVSHGHRLNKYFVGESVLLLPFFLSALLISFITGNDLSGYSFYFQVFTGLGTLFYLFLGLEFLRRLLNRMNIGAMAITISLATWIFGSNLFYYSLWQPTMSHVFSFFAINGFFLFCHRFIRVQSVKNGVWTGLFLGIVCLIRPTNVIVIFLIPFLHGGRFRFSGFYHKLRKRRLPLLLFAAILVMLVSLQCLVWYLQTGHFFEWSYQNEGFRFTTPEISNVLLSYRKGLFIYTPLTLISLTGLLILINNRIQFVSMVAFLILSTYVIASWWNWYYGDGFGLRAFIDYYGIFIILFASILNRLRVESYWIPVCLVLAPLLILNLVQTWQYSHKVIQPGSMNATKYHYVFMRTDSAAINSLGGCEEIADFNINTTAPVKVFRSDFEKTGKDWNMSSVIPSSRAFSGNLAGYMDSIHPFGPGIAVKARQISRSDSPWFVRGEVMTWDSMTGASNHVMLVLSMDSIKPGKNWWQGIKINDIPVNSAKRWQKHTFSMMLPEFPDQERILKIYLWNTGKQPMLADDFKLEFYCPY